jgi:hypothetical protein
MFTFVLVVLFCAVAAYAAYKSKTPEGWDWKKGWAAVAALAGAVWLWVSGFADKF